MHLVKRSITEFFEVIYWRLLKNILSSCNVLPDIITNNILALSFSKMMIRKYIFNILSNVQECV